MSGYDVIIIGSGPGGYAAALKACKSGMRTALVEKDLVGGTCINWGCVPTKVLIKYAKLKNVAPATEYSEARDKCLKIASERRGKLELLFKEAGISLHAGAARLTGVNEIELDPSGEKLTGKNIIIATGFNPNRIDGVEYDGADIVTVREALRFEKPPASAVIVGSGATGMEIATVWNSFGTKVTVLEKLPCIMGLDDDVLSKTAEDHFRDSGIQILTGVNIESIVKTAAGVEVKFSAGSGAGANSGANPGVSAGSGATKLVAEKAMIAAGVSPNSGGIGLEAIGVEMDRGSINIDGGMRTNIPGIYAIGDVTGKLALAMAASIQGMSAAGSIAGEDIKTPVYENIPRCVFSGIEAAFVGLSERQAEQRGFSAVTTRRPFKPYGKPVKPGEGEGIIKVVADAKTNKALGAVMLGYDATDQIAIPTRLIQLGAAAADVINSVCDVR